MMKRTVIAAAATAGALLLTACGSDGSAGKKSEDHAGMSGMHGSTGAAAPAKIGPPASGAHNSQDVTFATDMIPHHTQAVTMADLALTKATNPTVKKLAMAIKGAQDPEIAAMSGWLVGWGKPVPSRSMTMDHGNMSMPGMMSKSEMDALGNAAGTAFDKLWLTQMLTHHKGAVTMARTELASGQNADSKALAQSIITSQSKEIATMTALLPSIGS